MRATKAKRKEQRGKEEGGAVCPRRMNEIFISDTEETGLLSRIFSLLSTYSFSSSSPLHPFQCSFSAVFLSLSLYLFLLLPLLSLVSPLVEVCLSASPALFFQTLYH